MGFIFGLVRAVLTLIGGITVILGILIGVAVWQLSQPSTLESKMHEVAADPASAARFDEKIQQLEETLLSLEAGEEATLDLTEEEVTSKIVQEIENTDIPVKVKDVSVNFTDGKVLILGKVDVGLELSAGLEIEMRVDEKGEPKILVGELGIGRGFGIPQAAKDAIANVIPSEDVLTGMIKDLPIDLRSIDIGNGRLAFSGVKE